MDTGDAEAYRDFVARREHDLLRTAYLLCGDRGHAEDLLQTSLLQLFRAWPRLRDVGAAEAYVRRSLCRERTSWWRRRSNREQPVDVVAERTTADPTIAADDRDLVLRALATLPPRQRAVVVLRFYADLSEAATAQALGCSVGTVKSHTNHAMTRLRRYEQLALAHGTVAGERR